MIGRADATPYIGHYSTDGAIPHYGSSILTAAMAPIAVINKQKAPAISVWHLVL